MRTAGDRRALGPRDARGADGGAGRARPPGRGTAGDRDGLIQPPSRSPAGETAHRGTAASLAAVPRVVAVLGDSGPCPVPSWWRSVPSGPPLAVVALRFVGGVLLSPGRRPCRRGARTGGKCRSEV
ncbi:hypothetical protein SAM23877_6311 [Streptomyces ambofaciens ATCC 23877]|uniref:Uncharacterized protein n=1 Tax=Streptomyces ambofaciens (strain ATCC 23877 / 3486 / DSM 40053 / JCM 4204 / NBRC 12836 / NRRL B-2516) TaxID=278992 RepID=A0A0K2B2H9_STRA7|nr:hypothetical protein SAM23877_6311 [Streptomyces ambofaciens ATCC 23877]